MDYSGNAQFEKKHGIKISDVEYFECKCGFCSDTKQDRKVHLDKNPDHGGMVYSTSSDSISIHTKVGK